MVFLIRHKTKHLLFTLHISQADVETANYERISHPLRIIRKDFKSSGHLSVWKDGGIRERTAKVRGIRRCLARKGKAGP